MKRFTIFFIIVSFWVLSLVAAVRFYTKGLPDGNLAGQKNFQIQRVVQEESTVIDDVSKVSPSVVSIAVQNQLFGQFGGIIGQGPNSKEAGIGSGFVVSDGGLILTNKHVVADDQLKYIAIIRGNDGSEKKYDIVKINRDPFNDLALVQINASGLKPVELGDSDKLKVGQTVIAIGNALGQFENTVTTGVVSGLGRGVSPVDPTTGIAEKLNDLIQTDAAINPGNSGGPLVNSGGQVIGINSAIAEAQNIGFAIKVNVAKQLISDFQKSGGKISRPFLGIRYTHITQESALLNSVPQGEYVSQVVSGSAADKAGVKVGDIVTELDGKKLTNENALTDIIRGKKVGDSVAIRVYRGGNTLDMSATLGEASNTNT